MYKYDTLPANDGIRVAFGGYDKIIPQDDLRVITWVIESDGPYTGRVFTKAHISEFKDYVSAYSALV